jgi:SAM-dependent methyltransferase
VAHHGTGDHQDMLEYRDLESEALPTHWVSVLEWLGEAAAGIEPRRILDLGAGTGVAALFLAKRFSDAEVIALDVDASALAAIRTKAGPALVADRIVTLEVDLDHAWPDLIDLDLTWASMSMHHLAEPDRVLRELLSVTRPGGLIAVAEGHADLRLLPDDVGVGRPGLEARCLAAQAAEHAVSLPTMGSDWASRLRDAGWTVLAERTFALDEDPPVLPATARYAEMRLQRLRHGLAERLAEDDRAAIDVLLDESSPHFVGRRTDFQVSGSRTVALASAA